MKKMTALMMMSTSALIPATPNPTTMAVLLTLSSIAAAALTKTTIQSPWAPAILILTYSSGMMIMFMYIASLSPNEPQKKSKIPLLLPPLAMLATPSSSWTPTKPTETMFSNKSPLLMGVLLLMAMSMMTKATQKMKSPMNPSK